jgi:16S rRNA (cytosine967-C5)-methyltransferase
MARPRTSPQPEVPGLAARRIAADILDGVLRRRIALDELLSGKNAHTGLSTLPDRDRALTRRLAATVLRRLGTLRHLVGGFLEKGFPADAPRAEIILLLGAAQILWLEVPDHAAVDLSVRLAQADRRAARYAGLVNAVLRRVAQIGATVQSGDVSRDTPDWLLKRWSKTYGRDTARAIATAIGHEPALDITVKDNADSWAERLRGRVLPTGTVRTSAHGAISLLPGFSEGAGGCRTQPQRCRRLFDDARGASPTSARHRVEKRAARAAARGDVLAAQPARENLRVWPQSGYRRPTHWSGGGTVRCDLLDSPCSSTGTIRRHPDVPWLKTEADLSALTSLQHRLLNRAVEMLKPGGTLVYCVCSLEPEEGEDQITALLTRDPRVMRRPVTPQDVFDRREFVTDNGDLQTLPMHLPDSDPRWGGLDGFYAARLTRKSA